MHRIAAAPVGFRLVTAVPGARRARALVGHVRTILRSMLGQMVLATILFVGSGIYMFALAPILEMPPLGQPDPIVSTLSLIHDRFSEAILSPDAGTAGVRAALRDPQMQEVQRRNPDFRYYIAHDDAVLATMRPRYWQSLGLARLDATRRGMAEPSLCTQMQKSIRDERGGGYVDYINCGTLKYIEFTGIRSPIVVPMPTPMQAYGRWLWSYSRNFVLPSLGIFLVLVAILSFNVLRIRRVARLTRTLGADLPERLLPEAGLPSEVTPLVQAMNGMITRADDAQRRRRFFLSAAAHEMRTPLTILRTRLESLADGWIKTRLIDDLSRLTTLSNDLLTLTSIDGRKRPFASVDIVSCCLDVIGDLEDIAVARDVTFKFVEPNEPMIVRGDAALLKSAIANLVDNALSFAPPGSAVIVALDDEGGLDVRDFGPGIRSIDADTLFEPFVRATSQRPGHGLGLAIVRAVAELHGATVSAGNAAGSGALFRMRFPDHDASLRSG